MAISFNPYLRSSAGLTQGIYRCLFRPGTTIRLRLFTTSYPTAPINFITEAGTGFTLELTPTFMLSSPSNIQLAGGSTNGNALVSGIISWFALYSSSGEVMISDSIGLNGANRIATVSTLNAIVGQPISLTAFNLRLV